MNINNTYRLVVACFLAGLMCFVFITQSLHHIVDHHHEEDACTIEGEHIHDEAHKHFSCSICFFHFEPTEESESNLISLSILNIVSNKVLSNKTKILYTLKLRQSYLRGPPSFTV